MNQHPRLRSHTRRRKSGRVVTYYLYDMRGTGEPDIPLGTDYASALAKWHELHHERPRIAGTLMEAFRRWRVERLPLYERKVTRDGYGKQLARLEPVFGASRWDDVRMSHLVEYAQRRSGKTQANRELAVLSIVWNWARTVDLTKLPFPAAGMSRSRWKNRERPRKVEVTEALFAAIYRHADPMLRDAMDIASATGLRLTDARTVLMPREHIITGTASKTGKPYAFDVRTSAVLPALIERRRASKAAHLMLLTSERGQPVTERMLTDRFARARAAAVAEAEAIGEHAQAQALRGLLLRNMRSMAADLAESLDEARELLQHDDPRLTARHYRTRVRAKGTMR